MGTKIGIVKLSENLILKKTGSTANLKNGLLNKQDCHTRHCERIPALVAVEARQSS